MLDLHLHSTASDGCLTPDELMRFTHEQGAQWAALCDHDTTWGVSSAAQTAREIGLGFIPGVEVSAGGETEIHILGYGVKDDASSPLARLCGRMREDRRARLSRTIDNLNVAGISITEQMVLAQAQDRTSIGRPHIARALVALGAARDVRDAFARFLTPGCKTYVPREKVEPAEAIDVIRQSGGVPVLAHPMLSYTGLRRVREAVEQLTAQGLMGIECYHSAQSPLQAMDLRKLAQAHGLCITGGSDYHGGVVQRRKKTTMPLDGVRTFSDWQTQLDRLLAAIDAAGGHFVERT